MAEMNGKRVLAGVPDLFFASKISETARQLGLSVEFASSHKALVDKALTEPGLIILDLAAAPLDPVGLIGRMKADPALQAARIVAFANHERTDLIEQARAAGCDEVLTRGAFTKNLAGILTRSVRDSAETASESRGQG
jgi:CheY-like chemotaxis protein